MLRETMDSPEATSETISVRVGATLKEVERAIVARTLTAVKGNKKEAARLLGISRSSLYAKLARYGLRPRD